ncbi:MULTISPECIES: hypothetical protein [Frankia]|uniref:hypothetical protein n=1 Tax=Frankia TaxID=1854 RepID=UPI000FF88FD7|nr:MULTISPECIES: hypothetical protein [Frankia]
MPAGGPNLVPKAVHDLEAMGGKDQWFDVPSIQLWRIKNRGMSCTASPHGVKRQLRVGVENGYAEEHMGKYRIPVEGVDGATLPGYVPCPARDTDEDEA